MTAPLDPRTLLGRAVLRRDSGLCVGCAATVRPSRKAFRCRTPGRHAGSPSAWVTLCETCKTAGDGALRARGYLLPEGQDPARAPLMVFSPGGAGITTWLTPDSGYAFRAPEAAS